MCGRFQNRNGSIYYSDWLINKQFQGYIHNISGIDVNIKIWSILEMT